MCLYQMFENEILEVSTSYSGIQNFKYLGINLRKDV